METKKSEQVVLNEYQAKAFLKEKGIDVVDERLVVTREELSDAAKTLGYPVVVKGCSSSLLHKSEAGLVLVDIRDEKELNAAYDLIHRREKRIEGVLVQRMVPGRREFLVGIAHDPSFGACVVFGLGGVFTEALRDITYLVPPFTKEEAIRQCSSLSCARLLGPFRDEGPLSQEALGTMLTNLGKLALECPEILEVDLNPVKPLDDRMIAVDALLIVSKEFESKWL